MNMLVIRLSRENFPQILATESISPEELEEVMKKTVDRWSPIDLSKYYFVPTYDKQWMNGYTHEWTWLREDLLEDGTFTADMSRIDTEFVDLIRHYPK